jgi:hypothetical protein
MEGWHRYRRGSGGGAAYDVGAALDVMAAGRTGGGGATSDRMRETKEEWAAKAGVAGWAECHLGRRGEKTKKKVGWAARMTGPK